MPDRFTLRASAITRSGDHPSEEIDMIDEELERAIDRAGRDRVFARTRRHGWWAGSTPPQWVLWGIVRELTLEQARSPAGIYTGPRLVVDNTKGALPA